MKANEFRIGNWVEAVSPMGNYYMRVTAHNFVDIANFPECANFIPLTPQILEKAGFEKIYKGKMHTSFYKDKVFYYFWHETNRQYADISGNQYDHINSVHQLQNLIFALTGEELNIKL